MAFKKRKDFTPKKEDSTFSKRRKSKSINKDLFPELNEDMVYENRVSYLSPLGSRTLPSLGVADKSKDRVIINVGGYRHECYISTIQSFPDTRLYWIAETALKMADFDPDGNEFFFDRHPGCFQNILNYCRTGQLHCPNDVCGPLFEQELAFWGVDELMMEPCCWGNYTQHRDAHKNLKMFDEMHRNSEEEQREKEAEMDEEELENMRRKIREMGTFQKFIMKLRPELWSMLEKPYSSKYAQVIALISMMVIILSITTFCLQTMEYFKEQYSIFQKLEYFYCALFTFEFAVRLLCCPSFKTLFLSVMTWIDFVSTVQFYFSFFGGPEKFGYLDFLFVLRLIRIFRLFRFFKNLSGMQVIAQTLKASANELFLLVLIVSIPMVIFSTLMFYAEKGQTQSTMFRSIPESFWWAIVTMTTVGYGDVVPKSGYGKIVGAMCACSGVLIVALPVSVIGSNFTLYYSYAQARMRLPKRRSPALVTADKALVNNQDDGSKNDGTSAATGNGNGLVPYGLQDLANVMVDLSVPSARRHALTPGINPISSHRKRKRKQQKASLTSALAAMTPFAFNLQPQTSESENETSNITDDSEKTKKKEKSNLNDTESPYASSIASENVDIEINDNNNETISKYKVFRSNSKVRSRSEMRNNQSSLIAMRTLSKSCTDASADEMQETLLEKRTRRIIHAGSDLAKYIPQRISPKDCYTRRKISQQNHVYHRSLPVNVNDRVKPYIETVDSIAPRKYSVPKNKSSVGLRSDINSPHPSPLVHVILTDDKELKEPLL